MNQRLSKLRNFASFIRLIYQNSLRAGLIRIFALTKQAPIYYAAISRVFRNEQNATISGIRTFINRDKTNTNLYFLRRNIHRIEKGLVMRPRRECFASDYILKTVLSFRALHKTGDTDKRLLKWSQDVLELYFSVAKGDDQIEQAKKIFREFECDEEKKGLKYVPESRASAPRSAIGYLDLLKLARRRRSVRWYSKKPVARKLIDDAIEVANLAPSACNRQPFEFRVFDDPRIVERIMKIPGGTSGWSHSPPVVVVMVGHMNAFYEERDRHLIYIDSSLAVMSFMFALETLGLSSCAINFPDIAKKNSEMAAILGLETYHVVTMVVSVGYADNEGLVPYSAKKEIASLRSYNQYNNKD